MPSGNPHLISSKLEEKFYQKIKYNFKLHVLLCLKGSNCNRQNVLGKIYMLEGYRCHKVAKYGSNWSHLHIKFIEEDQALAAVDFFKTEESGLTAVLVDDLLKDWFSFEMRSNCRPPWTLAIIDVVGSTPRFLNFLTERILAGILEDFGRPFLLPYTAALAETHVQVLFSSMTEALAACMAFGQWYRTNLKSDQFFYRVRISPSNKEALLIKISGGVPEEAFKLDYFLNQRRIHRPSVGCVKGSGAFPKGSKSACHGKGHPADINNRDVVKATNNCVAVKTKPRDSVKAIKPHEMIKTNSHNVVKTKSGRSSAFQQKIRSPFICIPILTGVASLTTTDSLHTAVFPKGFDEAARLRTETTETLVYGVSDSVDLFGSGATEALETFDNVQEDARRSEVDFSNSLQQMTMQTMPCAITPDYYCGKALVFESKKYTL